MDLVTDNDRTHHVYFTVTWVWRLAGNLLFRRYVKIASYVVALESESFVRTGLGTSMYVVCLPGVVIFLDKTQIQFDQTHPKNHVSSVTLACDAGC